VNRLWDVSKKARSHATAGQGVEILRIERSHHGEAALPTTTVEPLLAGRLTAIDSRSAKNEKF
jgi:hypothetical protein